VFGGCEILSGVALRLGKIVERHSQFKRATSNEEIAKISSFNF
jgi:hypothetical protein